MGDTPLMAASTWTDLKVNHNRTDETRNHEIIKNGALPVLRTSFATQSHTHHSISRVPSVQGHLSHVFTVASLISAKNGFNIRISVW